MMPQTSAPTSVYRYYDANDLLLYVGITSRGTARNREHNASKEWWPFVVRQEVEHYPNRKQAADRERALIRRYRPPFNKVHNIGSDEMSAAYLQLAANGGVTTGSLFRSVYPSVPRGRRIPLEASPNGDALLLTSYSEDTGMTQPLNLKDPFPLGSSGRKANARSTVRRADGRLQIRVVGPRLHDCLGGLLMFRMSPDGGCPLNIKRVDLIFPNTKKVAV